MGSKARRGEGTRLRHSITGSTSCVTLHWTGAFFFLIVQDMFFNSFSVCVGTGNKSEFLSEG